jgi:hypothetical protein
MQTILQIGNIGSISNKLENWNSHFLQLLTNSNDSFK